MKGTTGIRLRRESAKSRLEAQLKRGTKANMIPLTPGDIARINKEIAAINNPKKKTGAKA